MERQSRATGHGVLNQPESRASRQPARLPMPAGPRAATPGGSHGQRHQHVRTLRHGHDGIPRGDPDTPGRHAGVLRGADHTPAVARRGGGPRLHRDEPRPARPGRLAGRRGLPGRGARPLLLGQPARLPAHDHARPRRAPGQVVRRHRGRAPVAPGPRGLHRAHRRHRVLHGRRLRAGAGAAATASTPPSVNYGGCPSDAETWLPDGVPDRGELRRHGRLAPGPARRQAARATAHRAGGPPRRQDLPRRRATAS